MAAMDFLKRRFERLQKAAKSLEEAKILIKMQEEDGQDTSEQRAKLNDEVEANLRSQESTLKAIEELKALEENNSGE